MMNASPIQAEPPDHGGDSIGAIQESVRRRFPTRLRSFRVQSADDGLILSGQASSYYIKQLAQEAVKAATRARIVSNAIEVVSSDRPSR